MLQADKSSHQRVVHQIVSVVSPRKAMQESGFGNDICRGSFNPFRASQTFMVSAHDRQYL